MNARAARWMVDIAALVGLTGCWVPAVGEPCEGGEGCTSQQRPPNAEPLLGDSSFAEATAEAPPPWP